MDVSKLKFDIRVSYDCDEGEDCDQSLENGTYDEAVALFNDLESRTWIDHYYHYMSINVFSIHDENGNELDLEKILDGEYSWIPDYSSYTKSEASETPAACLEFLEALKNGEEWLGQKQIIDLKNKIKHLEWELDSAKKELEALEREQA